MTPPPCDCAHVEQIVVWMRSEKAPQMQRHNRCVHPSGPHPMHEFCAWRAPRPDGIPQ